MAGCRMQSCREPHEPPSAADSVTYAMAGIVARRSSKIRPASTTSSRQSGGCINSSHCPGRGRSDDGKGCGKPTRCLLSEHLENPDAAEKFALFLARRAQVRLRDKKVQDRFRQLANHAVKELKSNLDQPTEDGKRRLLDLLHEITKEQNEYSPI